MFQTKFVEKLRRYNLYSIILFEYRAVYEITLENTVEPDGLRMTIWRLRIA